MKHIKDYNFSGKKVLVRVDFNVPLDKQTLQVTDATRIKAALPTINKILQDGGAVILMSHLGRPKTGPEDKYSLTHIVNTLSALVGKEVLFVNDCIGENASAAAKELKFGEIMLLENLRFHAEEEKGDIAFAKALASLGDVYVNDAFGTAHRAHASTSIIADYFSSEHKMFGYLMGAEIEAANYVLHNHKKPFTAILGGAKVSDKILIIEKLLEKANTIVIGGGMAYTFFKAQGGTIGNSLCEDDRLELAKELLQKAKQKNVTILLPVDSVIADKFDNDASVKNAQSNEIPSGWMGLDIGETAIAQFKACILKSKTILWNGPMGVFEMSSYKNGTIEIAKAITEATKLGAYSLVGGGDSVAAVNQFGMADDVSYVSTGGGAMLEFFEGKLLPGIAAIEK